MFEHNLAAARTPLTLAILILTCAVTIQQAFAPSQLLRDAIGGDPQRHLSAAEEQTAHFDAWIRDVSQGKPIAMRFHAATQPTASHRLTAANFYLRGAYTLYPSRIYVTASDDQVVADAGDLVERQFNPDPRWCAQRGIKRIVTIVFSGAEDVWVESIDLPPPPPAEIKP
jgi:hypothetical protein